MNTSGNENYPGQIKYKEGYKYQLVEDSCPFQTTLRPLLGVDTGWIHLGTDGILIGRVGYAWDGPSGPTFDTPDSMRGSLAHDMLYQLMREDHIPITCKDAADSLLRDICIADGMPHWRAEMWHEAVKCFGVSSATYVEVIIIVPLVETEGD